MRVKKLAVEKWWYGGKTIFYFFPFLQPLIDIQCNLNVIYDVLLIFNFVEKLDYICKNKFKAPTIPLLREQLLIFSCVLFQTFSMSRGKK